MQRGFVLGALLGALLALGAGLAIAFLPTTPSWALWRLTIALDENDVQELSELVDLPSLALRAMQDLGGEQDDDPQNLQISRLAMAFLSGDRIRTVFDDPARPLTITPTDFLLAWWSMRREGPLATLSLRAGDREVHLEMQQQPDLSWKVVAVSPLGALLRVEQAARSAPGESPAPRQGTTAPAAARSTNSPRCAWA